MFVGSWKGSVYLTSKADRLGDAGGSNGLTVYFGLCGLGGIGGGEEGNGGKGGIGTVVNRKAELGILIGEGGWNM